MALSKETQIQMIAFIKAHYDHLTLTDMAEELAHLGINYSHIHTMCSKLGIVPITVKMQIRKFLLEYHHTRTVAQLARSLNFCDQYVIRLCKGLGVTPFEIPPVVQETAEPAVTALAAPAGKLKSPGQILSEFTMSGANHYSAYSTYPVLFADK